MEAAFFGSDDDLENYESDPPEKDNSEEFEDDSHMELELHIDDEHDDDDDMHDDDDDDEDDDDDIHDDDDVHHDLPDEESDIYDDEDDLMDPEQTDARRDIWSNMEWDKD